MIKSGREFIKRFEENEGTIPKKNKETNVYVLSSCRKNIRGCVCEIVSQNQEVEIGDVR